MVVVYGTRLFGKVDTLDDTGVHVATKFFHISWIPLIPLGSFLVIEDTGDRHRGASVPLSFKSVLVAYLRAACIPFGVGAGVVLCIQEEWLFGVPLGALSLGFFIASYWIFVARGARRAELLQRIGAGGTVPRVGAAGGGRVRPHRAPGRRMMRRRTGLLVVGCFVGFTSVGGCGGRGSPPSKASPVAPTRDVALEETLGRIAGAHDGVVAVSVRHLGTGVHAAVNGDKRLPMMSVFKLPLAFVALDAVGRGKHRLDEPVTFSEADLRKEVSPLSEAWHKGEHAPSLETVLVRTVQDSDNAGGDRLVSFLGGGAAITARLRAAGVGGVDVVEPEIEMFGRLGCPDAPAPPSGWTMAAIEACPAAGPGRRLAAAKAEVTASPNVATTDGLVQLLSALDARTFLGAERSVWLLDVLAGTKTGVNRLKGKLPPSARVEHKTGTGDTVEGFNIATNDVGILVLPGGTRVAVAVLTAGSTNDLAAREAVIARIARAVWDRFSPT